MEPLRYRIESCVSKDSQRRDFMMEDGFSKNGHMTRNPSHVGHYPPSTFLMGAMTAGEWHSCLMAMEFVEDAVLDTSRVVKEWSLIPSYRPMTM